MRNPFVSRLFRVCFLLLVPFSLAVQAQSNAVPNFEEVYKLLQNNLGSMSRQELDQSIVRGMLRELNPQVLIVSSNNASTSETGTNQLGKSTIYDSSFVYLRLKHIEADVAEQLARKYQHLAASNKIKGLVLDLRFANGDDYAAAAAAADKFLNSEQPLINWGNGSASSTTKSNPISVPVTVLVNGETRGAAEALAGALRETRVALVIGSTTAGEASVFKDFALSNGQTLRIAVAPVKVGKDGAVLSKGLKPDIEVTIPAADEKLYLADAYRLPAATVEPATTGDTNTLAGASSTNQARTRMNEAELVRRHREGLSVDEIIEERGRTDPELKLVRDPALARALDLLKGLAVVGQSRPL